MLKYSIMKMLCSIKSKPTYKSLKNNKIKQTNLSNKICLIFLILLPKCFSKIREVSKADFRKLTKRQYDTEMFRDIQQKISDLENHQLRTGYTDDVHQRYLAQLRKFLQLQKITLFLQPNTTIIDSYVNYGCHCLPKGFSEVAAVGYGRPVDAVDKACLMQSKCHMCVELEHENCDPSSTNYRYKLLFDSDYTFNLSLRDVECIDSWDDDPCRRATCECDRGLALRLREAQKIYNPDFHYRTSQFDIEKNCQTFPQYDMEKDCCGDYDNIGSRQLYRKGQKQCCNNKIIYDSYSEECCEDGTVVNVGNSC